MNRADGNVALLVSENNCAQHDLFRQLACLGLHHQHSRLGTGNDQIQAGLFACRLPRIEHIGTVHITYARSANRAAERHTADRQGRAGGDQGRNVGVHFGIQGQGVNHHMHLIEETLGKERADRTVDQTAGQRFILAWTAFPLEKTAWNLAGGIGLFQVINGQREEVLTGLAFGLGNYRCQNDGAVHVEQYRSVRLASDFAGLHGDGVGTPLESLGDLVEHAHCIYLLVKHGRCGPPHPSPESTWQNTMPFQRNSPSQGPME